MYTADLLLADRIAVKAKELQTTNSFLSCALGVIHLHKDFLDVWEHKNELDCFIAKAYIKQVIEGLILNATQWLLSPLPNRQKRGSWLVELMSEKDVDQHPEYRAYRHLLHATTGEAPLMRLHLQALEQVAAQSRKLRKACKKATITESILENFAEDMPRYFYLPVKHQGSPSVG
jgi:hypothetical protein